jgi:hypothetical protein
MATGDTATTGRKTGAKTEPGVKPVRPKPSAAARVAARLRRRNRPNNTSWKRFLLRLTGWGFIVLGILGIFLPILQGILFLLVGMYILGRVSPRMRMWRMHFRRKARERYPSWTGKFEEAEVKAKYWTNRILKPNRKKS